MIIRTTYQVKDDAKAIVHVLKDIYAEKHIEGAEVGVFRGYNAYNLLTNLDVQLLLIDPYIAYNDFNNSTDLAEAKQIAKERLSPFGDRACWKYMPSLEAVKEVPHKLNFAYLDNSHRHADLRNELPLWYSVLEMGGILCGDDFVRVGSYKDMEVFTTICELAAKNEINICISDDNYSDWWLIKDREQLNLWI